MLCMTGWKPWTVAGWAGQFGDSPKSPRSARRGKLMTHRFRPAAFFPLPLLFGLLSVAAWPASADGEATPTSGSTATAASPKAWSLEEIEEPQPDGRGS